MAAGQTENLTAAVTMWTSVIVSLSCQSQIELDCPVSLTVLAHAFSAYFSLIRNSNLLIRLELPTLQTEYKHSHLVMKATYAFTPYFDNCDLSASVCTSPRIVFFFLSLTGRPPLPVEAKPSVFPSTGG